jgi:hypothetical protein
MNLFRPVYLNRNLLTAVPFVAFRLSPYDYQGRKINMCRSYIASLCILKHGNARIADHSGRAV